ncbi:Crustapain [Pseudolycoriella hygida]|uniref:Crustapain n=1 Tax=Pseudolycoriella hygida TaxID=35572 RepID=A0A9Q0N7T5_9DIPT|nr:Crustapain [Pseudolycoriella hygida]
MIWLTNKCMNSQLFPVFLFTFSFTLSGIDAENNSTDTKIQVSVCPPNTTGVFPNCELLPTGDQQCDEGFTGTFPDCVKIKKPKCRLPNIGTYPNCFIPPCPPSYSGKFPKCQRQPNEIKCPAGSAGVFPMCHITTLNLSDVTEESSTSQNDDSSLNAELLTLEGTTQQPSGDESDDPNETNNELTATTQEVQLTTTGISLETTSDGFKREKPKKCRHPLIGSFPNCFRPPCPPQYSGTYPKCIRSAGHVCPSGSTGTFPNCIVEPQKCGGRCDETLPPASSQSSGTKHPLSVSQKIEWEDFKTMFNKTYANATEEAKRQQIFLLNQKIIEAHNRLFDLGIETYSLGIHESIDESYYGHVEEIGRRENISESAKNGALHLVYAKTINDSEAVTEKH